jgi:hypothetical protein
MVNSGDLQDRPPLQMKTIIYNDEAAPWSRNSHLMGTKSLPSSDDSNNIFSRTLQHTCDQDCITMYNSCLLASILLSTYTISCLYPEDGWRWAECLLCLFPRCYKLCNQCFFAFTMPFYLVFRDWWQTWHMESQEFGPRVQNSGFSMTDK